MVVEREIKRYEAEVSRIPKLKIDKELLETIILCVGPSIYHPIHAYIDYNDQEEIKKVKTHFLIGKLNLKDTEELDKSLSGIIDFFNQNKLEKYRVLFYYFVVVDLELSSNLIQNTSFIESEAALDTILLEFGEKLIRKQKDIDLDLKKILNDNFSSLI